MKKSQQLRAEMAKKWEEIKGIRDLVVKEDRDFTEEEQVKIDGALAQVREYEQLAEKEEKQDALIKQLDAMGAIVDSQPNDPGQKGRQPNGQQPGGQRGREKSLGQQFIESDEWKAWFKKNAPSGRIPDSLKGISSPPVQIKNLLQKTLVTGSSDSSAGAFVQTDYTGIYESLGRYPLMLRNLISVRTTTSDLVEFVRQLTQITQAVPVPEANVTTYTGATGEVSGEKPEGAMTFLKVQEAVKTIAVWLPATKRALSDVGQLRGIIDDEGRADLNEELENQMLNGDGTGENFTGLNYTSGVLAQPFVTNIAVTARKAITTLLISGRQMPTGWLMNPQDWESFDLLTDSNGRYYWGGPMAMGPRTLWGVPVAQSFLQTAGTGWLGNWTKAVLWDREEANVSVSDSHEDFFIRNMVAILFELRAAFGIIRPSAFVEVDLESGS